MKKFNLQSYSRILFFTVLFIFFSLFHNSWYAFYSFFIIAKSNFTSVAERAIKQEKMEA